MMVDEALAQTVDTVPESKLLLSSKFDLVIEGKQYQQVTASLYHDCIFIELNVSPFLYRKKIKKIT